MTRILSVLALLVAVVALPINADEKAKEVTLEGTITCAKCDIKKAAKCETVIVVKEKDKDVVYSFDADAHKKFHGDTCTEAKKGKVTGTVKKDGDKMIVTVSKVEYAK